MITTRDLYISTIKYELLIVNQKFIQSGYSRSACRFHGRSNAATCRSPFFLKTSIRVSTDTIFRWSIVKRQTKNETQVLSMKMDGFLFIGNKGVIIDLFHI